MRILYHHRTRAEDAQGIHIRELIDAFRKLGHEVNVVGLEPLEDDRSEVKSQSLVSRLTAKLPPLLYEMCEILYNIYGFFILQKVVREFRPHLIYERYSLYTVAGIMVSKMYSIPLVLEVNAPIAIEKQKYSKLSLSYLGRSLERWICSNAYRTIVVSTPLREILAANGVPLDKMLVISNAINPDLIDSDVDGSEIRRRLMLDGKLVLGFVGWFRKWHGLDQLLRAYVQYDMLNKGIHLLLVGDGPAFPDLINFSKRNGIFAKGVTFTGPVRREEVARYMAAFDIALQPDVTEYASPIKLFEYMGMGKPILAPDTLNIKEILTEEYKGLFDHKDRNALAGKILELAESKQILSELGNESKNILARKRYFWTENARKTLSLLVN